MDERTSRALFAFFGFVSLDQWALWETKEDGNEINLLIYLENLGKAFLW